VVGTADDAIGYFSNDGNVMATNGLIQGNTTRDTQGAEFSSPKALAGYVGATASSENQPALL